MRPYGAKLPNKHHPTWECVCCSSDYCKHPRAAEKAWTAELIEEQTADDNRDESDPSP